AGSPTTGALGLEYWSAFRSHLIEAQSFMRSQKPLPRSWTSFAVGRTHFHLSAAFVRSQREIGIWLVLGGSLAKPHFRALARDREAIETELGSKLEWRELPDKTESNVVLRRSADPLDRDHWPEQHAWLRQTLEVFYRVFSPRVQARKADLPDPEAS